MLPKVVFKYSYIYNEHYRLDFKLDAKAGKKVKGAYPKDQIFYKYHDQLNKEWKKYGNEILKAIAKISKLEWKQKEIICYTVGRAIPISQPLTLPYYKSISRAIDVLTHELIHNLHVENKKCWPSYNQLYEQYSDESHTTAVHIPVLAVHAILLKELFGTRRLNEEIKTLKQWPDYRKAWEIVEAVGPEQIMKEFIANYKK